jgi:autotransporter adhesin
MAIVYTKTDQGLTVATGTGAPVHTAVAGDRYTDTANGNTYQYTTIWNLMPFSGGLVYFTEAQSTTAPNATVPVDSLTAVTATTNGDIAIVPKGTGAFALAVANNLVAGGNKRGANAIDLQSSRTVNSQVAGGARSFTAGSNNTASADDSVAIGRGSVASAYYSVAIGLQTYATGSYATAFGFSNNSSGNQSLTSGYGNVASGGSSVALGSSNTASGGASVAMGSSNTSSGLYSIALGYNNIANNEGAIAIGYGATSSNICAVAVGQGAVASNTDSLAIGRACSSSGVSSVTIGKSNIASGKVGVVLGYAGKDFGVSGRYVFSSSPCESGFINGDAQSSTLIITAITTDATLTTLVSDRTISTVPSAINQLVIQDISAMRIKGTIIAKQISTSNWASWDIDCVIGRTTGVATTSLTVSNVNVVTNIPSWGTPTLVADTTIGALSVKVQGLLATNIKWVCNLNSTEVIY